MTPCNRISVDNTDEICIRTVASGVGGAAGRRDELRRSVTHNPWPDGQGKNATFPSTLTTDELTPVRPDPCNVTRTHLPSTEVSLYHIYVRG